MGDKTQILSFWDALNEHKRLLTESLVNFNEGQRVRKIMLGIDSNSADYEYYFQSGQQSKQAEIGKLKSVITKQQIQMLQIQQSCSGCDSRDLLISELQKKIDDAINCLDKNKPPLKTNYKHAINALSILKGEETK